MPATKTKKKLQFPCRISQEDLMILVRAAKADDYTGEGGRPGVSTWAIEAAVAVAHAMERAR